MICFRSEFAFHAKGVCHFCYTTVRQKAGGNTLTFPLLVKLSGGVQEYNADCVLLSSKTCCTIMIIVEAERVSVDCQLFKKRSAGITVGYSNIPTR